ncbi:MAG: hypothetical protein RLZZ326_3612, partial [Planctomycetota bacterium]
IHPNWKAADGSNQPAGALLTHVEGSLSSPLFTHGFCRGAIFQSTYQGLNNNVSASHIHAQATGTPYVFPVGANWTVALNFSGSPSSTGSGAAAATWGPTTYTPANLSSAFVTAQGGNANTAFDNFVTFLSTGQAYYNLHTNTNTPTTGGGNPGGSLGAFFTAVPEIDPTSFGSALALLTGAMGLLERRMRRLRLTTTG